MKIVFVVIAVIGVVCCAAWGGMPADAKAKHGIGSIQEKRAYRDVGITAALTILSIIGVALT